MKSNSYGFLFSQNAWYMDEIITSYYIIYLFNL